MKAETNYLSNQESGREEADFVRGIHSYLCISLFQEQVIQGQFEYSEVHQGQFGCPNRSKCVKLYCSRRDKTECVKERQEITIYEGI